MADLQVQLHRLIDKVPRDMDLTFITPYAEHHGFKVRNFFYGDSVLIFFAKLLKIIFCHAATVVTEYVDDKRYCSP